MNRHIFLDMDGVLSDFLAGALKVLNREYGKDYKPSQYAELHGRFGINELYGISVKDFWRVLHAEPFFWVELPITPYGEKLFYWLEGIAPVTVVTCPSDDPSCAEQKLVWLTNHLGIKPSDVMLCCKKHLLAGNGLLIDDYHKFADEFTAAGGEAILVPSEWNNADVSFKMVVDKIQRNKYIQEWTSR
jgi:5'(3')-deoxyribonucleotidase